MWNISWTLRSETLHNFSILHILFSSSIYYRTSRSLHSIYCIQSTLKVHRHHYQHIQNQKARSGRKQFLETTKKSASLLLAITLSVWVNSTSHEFFIKFAGLIHIVLARSLKKKNQRNKIIFKKRCKDKQSMTHSANFQYHAR